MAKKTKEGVDKARVKLARAQDRYMKAVAKGERVVRMARERADERIAKAKAEFEYRATQLAEAEKRAGKQAVAAAAPNEVAAAAGLIETNPDQEIVLPNGPPDTDASIVTPTAGEPSPPAPTRRRKQHS